MKLTKALSGFAATGPGRLSFHSMKYRISVFGNIKYLFMIRYHRNASRPTRLAPRMNTGSRARSDNP